MKNFVRTATLGLGLVLAATLLLLSTRPVIAQAPAAGPAIPTDKGKGRVESTPVRTLVVRTQSFEESILATGTVRADESVEVRAEISGKLTGIHFEEGALIRAGQKLVSINDAEVRASLQRAVFRKELAELKTRRLSALRNQGGVTQQDYDIAASELDVLTAEVAVIQAQLEHTEIRAPFDGVVGLRTVSEGAYVTPSTKIATFQRLDRLKVDFNVPEKYAGRLNPGNAVAITPAGGGQPLPGRVHAIEPLVDPATRTVTVRAVCLNPSSRLFSGGFVQVRLTLAQIPDAILVPALAIVPGAGDQSVFVLENGLARRRPVRLGVRTESAVQVMEGLKSGDLVITTGLQQMRPGLPVRAIDDEPRGPRTPALADGHPAKATALN